MLKTDTLIPDLSIPNLDCLSDEDLDNAREAFEICSKLAVYIQVARDKRKEGLIVQAVAWESRAELLYRALPQALRY